MQQQDAIKARIKKLEGDVLGLMYRLRRLNNAPTFSSFGRVSQQFNQKTVRAQLDDAFHSAAQTSYVLQRQIAELRDELSHLTQTQAPIPEFTLAA